MTPSTSSSEARATSRSSTRTRRSRPSSPARTSSTSSPTSTIKIDTLAAIASESQNAEGAKAFYDWLHTDEAQEIWAENGYRPVVESILEENADKFPIPPDLFTIEDLGGWDKIMTDFFDPDNGKIAAIQKDLGAPIE